MYFRYRSMHYSHIFESQVRMSLFEDRENKDTNKNISFSMSTCKNAFSISRVSYNKR